METKLYVGNLSYDTGEEELLNFFKGAGNVVKCDIVLDKFTGRSRGFAFVVMGSPEDADNAIKSLDGQELDGRSLRVNIAKPREERSERGGGDYNRGGGARRHGGGGGRRGEGRF